MNIAMPTPRVTETSNPVTRGATQITFDPSDQALHSRLILGFDGLSTPYPILRTKRYCLKRPLELLLEDLAVSLPWRATRFTATKLLFSAEGLLIEVDGTNNRRHSSLSCTIRACSVEIATSTASIVESVFTDFLVRRRTFSVDWYFVDGKGSLVSASVEEIGDEPALDLAYPYLREGVGTFVERYLAAEEVVLVLQGPPGTGKTRLIRQILGSMPGCTDGKLAKVMYTGDVKALESDEIFAEFVSGNHDAFVVEDADEILKPRTNGNSDLHRFLAIADGIVRAQGRKLIFSTNLPNIGDLDDALVRPGRCFARLFVRRLTLDEALAFMDSLSEGRAGARQAVKRAGAESFSLADLYRLYSDWQGLLRLSDDFHAPVPFAPAVP